MNKNGGRIIGGGQVTQEDHPESELRRLSLGYSPCPNDTFIFYALVHGKISTGALRFSEVLEDVETLNRMAEEALLDVTKASFHAFGHLRDRYCLLRSGGALGRGCGPLLVARESSDARALRGRRIAIPGRLTTAFLLLELFDSDLGRNVKTMPFDEIIGAVTNGAVDAGLIIHESRFTYQRMGLKKVVDLGEWWESETGLPIPLGAILAKRGLGSNLIRDIDRLLRKSIEYAFSHREEPKSYIKAHSQEMEDSVIEQHIGLYVNDYSLDIGDDGEAAVCELIKRAAERGIIKESGLSLFAG